MDNKNIISAAQARLNFCDPEYVALYKEINNRIVDESRNKSSLEIKTEVTSTVRNRVISELKELGYVADAYYYSGKVFVLTVQW